MFSYSSSNMTQFLPFDERFAKTRSDYTAGYVSRIILWDLKCFSSYFSVGLLASVNMPYTYRLLSGINYMVA
jgi:hypothetical protein